MSLFKCFIQVFWCQNTDAFNVYTLNVHYSNIIISYSPALFIITKATIQIWCVSKYLELKLMKVQNGNKSFHLKEVQIKPDFARFEMTPAQSCTMLPAAHCCRAILISPLETGHLFSSQDYCFCFVLFFILALSLIIPGRIRTVRK